MIDTSKASAPLDHTAAANLRGILAMLAAMASFATGDILVKLAGRELPLGQVLFVRGLFASAMILAVAGAAGALRPVAAAGRPVLAWRTLAEAGASVLFFAGLMQLSYTEVIAVSQFTPLAVTAGAALFLAEPVGWRRWLAASAGLIGVLIIVRPGTAVFDWAAVLVVGSVLCIAARDLLTRRLDPAIPAPLVIAITSIAVMLVGLVLAPFETWHVPSTAAVVLLVCAATTVLCAYYWIIVAMQMGEVAVVSPFRYSVILFAAVASVLVFGEWPDQPTIVGALIVIAAGLYTLRRERMHRQ